MGIKLFQNCILKIEKRKIIKQILKTIKIFSY